MRIVTTPESVAVREGGPATGSIWLLLEGQDFPLSGWNDFVVVILAAWATALLQLLRGERERVMIHFMDGPYAVEVERTTPTSLHVRALEGPGRSTERICGHADLLPFTDDLVRQARSILGECRKREWWSSDAATLDAALAALEEECRTFQD